MIVRRHRNAAGLVSLGILDAPARASALGAGALVDVRPVPLQPLQQQLCPQQVPVGFGPAVCEHWALGWLGVTPAPQAHSCGHRVTVLESGWVPGLLSHPALLWVPLQKLHIPSSLLEPASRMDKWVSWQPCNQREGGRDQGIHLGCLSVRLSQDRTTP